MEDQNPDVGRTVAGSLPQQQNETQSQQSALRYVGPHLMQVRALWRGLMGAATALEREVLPGLAEAVRRQADSVLVVEAEAQEAAEAYDVVREQLGGTVTSAEDIAQAFDDLHGWLDGGAPLNGGKVGERLAAVLETPIRAVPADRHKGGGIEVRWEGTGHALKLYSDSRGQLGADPVRHQEIGDALKRGAACERALAAIYLCAQDPVAYVVGEPGTEQPAGLPPDVVPGDVLVKVYGLAASLIKAEQLAAGTRVDEMARRDREVAQLRGYLADAGRSLGLGLHALNTSATLGHLVMDAARIAEEVELASLRAQSLLWAGRTEARRAATASKNATTDV